MRFNWSNAIIFGWRDCEMNGWFDANQIQQSSRLMLVYIIRSVHRCGHGMCLSCDKNKILLNVFLWMPPPKSQTISIWIWMKSTHIDRFYLNVIQKLNKKKTHTLRHINKHIVLILCNLRRARAWPSISFNCCYPSRSFIAMQVSINKLTRFELHWKLHSVEKKGAANPLVGTHTVSII